MCKRMHKMWTKSKKSSQNWKIRQNSEVVEINDFPPVNLRKKIPACKKSTKFLHWNKISCLRSYNTYTCKKENTNFVRFKVTLCEFCWNFVGQQNSNKILFPSNKILFLLEFSHMRPSLVRGGAPGGWFHGAPSSSASTRQPARRSFPASVSNLVSDAGGSFFAY